MHGKQINLTADNTTIGSTHFSVDKDGNMTCNSADITGDIKSGSTITTPNFSVDVNGNMSCNNATFNGGKVELYGGTDQYNASFIVYKSTTDNSKYSYITGDSLTTFVGGSNYMQFHENQFICQFPNISLNVNNYTGQCVINGPVYATSFNNLSTVDVKKNIMQFNKKALEIVKEGKIYNFNYKKENDKDKQHIGFIIGKGYNTPSEVMSQDGQGIDTYSMISILWKAIQEQQEQIEKLQEEVIKLKGGK